LGYGGEEWEEMGLNGVKIGVFRMGARSFRGHLLN